MAEWPETEVRSIWNAPDGATVLSTDAPREKDSERVRTQQCPVALAESLICFEEPRRSRRYQEGQTETTLMLREGFMRTTPLDPEAIKREFALRRKRQVLVTLPIIAVVIAASVVADRLEEWAKLLPDALALVLLLAFTIGFFGFIVWNWRCPVCGWYLGKRLFPAFCWKCGVALR